MCSLLSGFQKFEVSLLFTEVSTMIAIPHTSRDSLSRQATNFMDASGCTDGIMDTLTEQNLLFVLSSLPLIGPDTWMFTTHINPQLPRSIAESRSIVDHMINHEKICHQIYRDFRVCFSVFSFFPNCEREGGSEDL